MTPAGAGALRDRLSGGSGNLSQTAQSGEDLSEEQVNQIIDQVQEAIRALSAPRRLASARLNRLWILKQIWKTTCVTPTEELNPEGIKRDLQLLLNDPRAGLGNLGDRLKQFDRSTLVALLSQREDITEEKRIRLPIK